jgi:hypothetical protein
MFFFAVICIFSKLYYSDEIKKDEVGGTCVACGGKEKCGHSIGEENRKKDVTWKT